MNMEWTPTIDGYIAEGVASGCVFILKRNVLTVRTPSGRNIKPFKDESQLQRLAEDFERRSILHGPYEDSNKNGVS